MSDCLNCNIIAELLLRYDIREVVASPGTRNAPLIAAIRSRKNFNLTMIVDERSAAFVALGKSVILTKPVAIICTSGSAVLNYAPALAEAYYSHVPLIVITADRPENLIDRNTGQTLCQPGSLSSVTNGCYTISSETSASDCELVINDALAMANISPSGPIHINVAIKNPMVNGSGYVDVNPRMIQVIERDNALAKKTVVDLAQKLVSPAKIMIAGGSYRPNERLNKALQRLSTYGNFVILAESGTNLHGCHAVTDVDALITLADNQVIVPDIIITFGAPLLSTKLKKFITCNNVEHWHIGITQRAADVFSTIKLRIESLPEAVLPQLAASIRRTEVRSDYSANVLAEYDRVRLQIKDSISKADWCELAAMESIIEAAPKSANVHLSNGMTIRYANHFDLSKFHRCDCNRGISGIDGSTSTAIGSATCYQGGCTLLLTGDMSARYDIGALGLRCVPKNFKMVVFCNGGGQIFKSINATRRFEAVDSCLVESEPFPVLEIAKSWGYDVYSASSLEELMDSLPAFFKNTERPALLAVYTDCEIDVTVNDNLLK